MRHATFLIAAACSLTVGLLASSASAADKPRRCEPAKHAAGKKKRKLCGGVAGLRDSRWSIVSAHWDQVLEIEVTDGESRFIGTSTAQLEAGRLRGTFRFPGPARPVVLAYGNGPVSFTATADGAWHSPSGTWDCSYVAPDTPDGFGGAMSVERRTVRVQWAVGGAGFGCGDGPHAPSPEFTDPISTYPISRFVGRRSVTLEIDLSATDPAFPVARNTFTGAVTLRRSR